MAQARRRGRRSAVLWLATLVLAAKLGAAEPELDEAFLEFLGLLSLAPEGLEDPMDLEGLLLEDEAATAEVPAASVPATVDEEDGGDDAL